MSARDDILAGLRQTDDGTVGDLTPEELIDAYRAEVLAETGQTYHGELLRHRGLIQVLRSHILHDDFNAVKQALNEFTEHDARDREKNSRPEPDAAPDFFQPDHTYTRNLPYRAPELRPDFECTGIGQHPTKNERRAFGFYRSGSMSPWGSVALNDDAWADGWVVVTRAREDA